MEEPMAMFRVEVSGWDQNERFFLERTALQWGQGEDRSVLLRQRVRQGALVFVRLLEPATQFRSFPVAFRARQVLERENGALYELKLSQVWPAADSQGAEATSMMHIAQGRAAGWN